MKKIGLFLLFVCVIANIFCLGNSSEKTDQESNYLLCKVWGFLKYYHPAVMEGRYDWDQELIVMFDKLKDVTSPKQRNELLLKWVDGLGTVVHNSDTDTIQKISFRQKIDFSWINSHIFDKNLTDRLHRIISAKRPDSSCYVSFHPENIPDFEQENPYPEIEPWNDIHYRFLTLCRAWNTIEYLYPYKYLTDKPWNSVLEESIPMFLAADDRKKFSMALFRFAAELNDTHVSVESENFYMSGEVFETGNSRTLPLLVEYIEDQCVVEKKFIDHPAIEIGDIITAIAGRNLRKYYNEMKPYISASNEGGYWGKFLYIITMTDKDSMDITIQRKGEAVGVRIPSYDVNDTIHFPVHREHSRLINNNIGYINIGRLPDSEVDSVIRKMSDTRGLILDLRRGVSPVIFYGLGNYLVKEEMPYTRCSTTSFEHFGSFRDNGIGTIGSEGSEHYPNKVVLIVNSVTMSIVEFTTMAWSTAPDVITIGSQTAGADGNVMQLPLIGNIYLGFTTIGIYYPDGGETQRVGVRIDEVVKPTIKGIREGRDEPLERAVEIIKQGK